MRYSLDHYSPIQGCTLTAQWRVESPGVSPLWHPGLSPKYHYSPVAFPGEDGILLGRRATTSDEKDKMRSQFLRAGYEEDYSGIKRCSPRCLNARCLITYEEDYSGIKRNITFASRKY
jgi:hypothetical protein